MKDISRLETELEEALARAERAEAREAELSKHLEWVLEEAEKAHMGYPSPAEEWFALRDSAKAVLSSDGGSAMLDRLRRAEARLEALREMMSVPGSSICHRSSSGLIVFQPTMSNKNYIYSGRKNYKPCVVRACTFDELIDQWQKAGG